MSPPAAGTRIYVNWGRLSRKKSGIAETKPPTVSVNGPNNPKEALKSIGGSQSDNWNNILTNQALQSLWLNNSNPQTRDRQYQATVAALIGIGAERRA